MSSSCLYVLVFTVENSSEMDLFILLLNTNADSLYTVKYNKTHFVRLFS